MGKDILSASTFGFKMFWQNVYFSQNYCAPDLLRSIYKSSFSKLS